MDTQEVAPEVEAVKVETTEPEVKVEERPSDDFKSDESKQSVLADLAKARAKAKELEEEIAKRDREKLSDIERAQAERDDFEKKWQEAEQARIRSDIARTKGVSPDLLVGTNAEEMTAHAERLLAWRGDKPVPPANPNPAQGVGNEVPAMSDEDKLYNSLFPKS